MGNMPGCGHLRRGRNEEVSHSIRIATDSLNQGGLNVVGFAERK